MPKKKSKLPYGAKKTFVASLPLDMPIPEVIAKAAAKGIELNNHQVSNIRWDVKQEAPKPVPKQPKLRLRSVTNTVTVTKPPSVAPKAPAAPTANGTAPKPIKVHPSSDGSLKSYAAEEQLRAAALQVGLLRSRVVLDDLEAALGKPS